MTLLFQNLWACFSILCWSTAKSTKCLVGSLMTKISQHIYPVWSVFTGGSLRSQGPKTYSCGQQRLPLASVDAQADLTESSLSAHPFACFARLWLIAVKSAIKPSLSSALVTSYDSNRPAQLQKLARVLKFRLYQVEILYYPGCEQQRRWSDCMDAQADLRLCCSHMA